MQPFPSHRFPNLQQMVVAFGCFLAPTAYAGITLDSMQAYLAPNRSIGELTVYNSSPTTAYVRVDVIEMTVKNDELKTEPGELEKKVLVSPNRLIVPAGGRQVVRLITLGERDHERYFRVRFVPVTPKKADGFAISDQDEENASKAMHAQLNLQVGYGARVVAAPRSPTFSTRIVPADGGHIVHNDGDSTIYLIEQRSCVRGSRECKSLPNERVDPQGSHRLADESGRYRTFNLKEGTATSPRTIGDTN